MAGYIQVAAAAAVGLPQAAVAGRGIRALVRPDERREQRHAETMAVLRRQGKALRTLIERIAPLPAARRDL